jgi:hypothetical protein
MRLLSLRAKVRQKARFRLTCDHRRQFAARPARVLALCAWNDYPAVPSSSSSRGGIEVKFKVLGDVEYINGIEAHPGTGHVLNPQFGRPQPGRTALKAHAYRDNFDVGWSRI